MSDLVQRLRGDYRISITDGLGPVGGAEPDNPNEFVRYFETPPIQKEAAAEIDRLRAALTTIMTILSDDDAIDLCNNLIALKGYPAFSCEYKNWRGEKSVRTIRPERIWYGSTEWHPEPCLLLYGMDRDKNAMRDFCLADFNFSTIRAA